MRSGTKKIGTRPGEQGVITHDVHRQAGSVPQSDRGTRAPSPEAEKKGESSSLKMDAASGALS